MSFSFSRRWTTSSAVQICIQLIRARTHLHEVCGDSVGAAGDGFELHSLQVHVFGQTPLQHVSYHTHATQRILKTRRQADKRWYRNQTVNILSAFHFHAHEATVTQPDWVPWNSLCVGWALTLERQLSKYGLIGARRQKRWLSQCGFQSKHSASCTSQWSLCRNTNWSLFRSSLQVCTTHWD